MSRSSTAATRAWRTQAGPVLKVWAPRPGQADLAGWWWPMHRVVRAVDRSAIPYELYLEDFMLVGAVPRSSRPDLWTYVYVHVRSGGELFVDVHGRTHRFQALRREWWRGRFTTCSLRQAVTATGAAQYPAPEVDRLALIWSTDDDDLPDTPQRVPWGPMLERPDGRTLAPLGAAEPSDDPDSDRPPTLRRPMPPARWPRRHPGATSGATILDHHRGRPCDGPSCPFCGPPPDLGGSESGRPTPPPASWPPLRLVPPGATAPFHPVEPHWN